MTRQEAIKWINGEITWHSSFPDSEELIKALYMAIDALEQEPIVHCKNCKHWGGVIFGNKCTMLSGLDYVIATKENDFCSYGEQTESEV